jgi:hypothetical protein
VFACCRVLMDGVAQVPFKVMRKTPSTCRVIPNRLDADEHDALRRAVSRSRTAGRLVRVSRADDAARAARPRGAFAYKNIVELGGRPRIAELILLDPERVTPKQARGLDAHLRGARPRRRRADVAQDQIWHLRGPSWNGFEALGHPAARARGDRPDDRAEDTHAKLHKNGVRPSGVFSVEGTLTSRSKRPDDWLKEQAAARTSAIR